MAEHCQVLEHLDIDGKMLHIKENVTSVRQQWRYVFLALTHGYIDGIGTWRVGIEGCQNTVCDYFEENNFQESIVFI